MFIVYWRGFSFDHSLINNYNNKNLKYENLNIYNPSTDGHGITIYDG